MKILVAGDFVPFGRVADKVNLGNYDCFDQIKPIVTGADFSIVNFECPVVEHKASAIQKVGPNIKCTTKGVDAIKWAGFNCVTLANNHMNDYGKTGIDDTIQALTDRGITYVGVGDNLEEASRILYKKIGEEVLGIINCCEHEFSIATKYRPGCNPLDPISQFAKIQEAKLKADYVLVIVHGGYEGYQLPSPRMQQTYRFFVDAGADAVLNHHQHCYGGYEVYKNKPIFYGLGNLCFDTLFKKTSRIWYEGYMVLLEFKDNGINYMIIPYYQCKNKPIVELAGDGAFAKEIKVLNECIGTPVKLETYFAELCKKRGRESVINAFAPFGNRYFLGLIKRHFIPSFISHKKILNAYPYLNCEAHRDILSFAISDILK